MWSPFGQIADNANCTRTHIRFGSFHLQFMSPLHTRTHLAAWLGLETVIMCAAHSTRTLDSTQYVTGPEPESCRVAIVRVRKVLRSYEQLACIVHCVIHCCLAAVRSAWSLCPFTGEPWASSLEPPVGEKVPFLALYVFHFIVYLLTFTMLFSKSP